MEKPTPVPWPLLVLEKMMYLRSKDRRSSVRIWPLPAPRYPKSSACLSRRSAWFALLDDKLAC